MSSSLQTILLIAMMVIAFYFLLLRPQRKRQQAQQKTQNEIQPGTRVLLGSGIFGTVIAVSEKQVVLETGPGSQVTVVKQAIARIIKPGDEYSEPAPEPVSPESISSGPISAGAEPADSASDDLPPAVGSGAFAAATGSEPPAASSEPTEPVAAGETEPKTN